MEFLPHIIAFLAFASLFIIPLALRIKRSGRIKTERPAYDELLKDLFTPNQSYKRQSTEQNEPSQPTRSEINFDRYLAWRGGRHHGSNTRPNTPTEQTFKCKTCQDTKKIIRGHDGRRIRCPTCS